MTHDLNRKMVAYGYLADHIPSGEKTELPISCTQNLSGSDAHEDQCLDQITTFVRIILASSKFTWYCSFLS